MHSRKFPMFLMVAAALLIGRTASASTELAYFATGQFAGGNGDATHAWLDLGNGATLNFYFNGAVLQDPSKMSVQSLGDFMVTAPTKTEKVKADFTLVIHQLLPTMDDIRITGTVRGKVYAQGAADLVASFIKRGRPEQADSGNIHYIPQNAAFTQVGQRVTLTGRIAAAPLPATAGVSALLLAGFGAWQYISRRRSA